MPWEASTSRTTPSHAARLRAHLVAEVDVARRVDQVERRSPPVHPDVLRLDRDAALALDVHRVEVLLAHFPRVDRAGELEDAVRERRLAVVDVTDDGEVPDLCWIDHVTIVPAVLEGSARFAPFSSVWPRFAPDWPAAAPGSITCSLSTDARDFVANIKSQIKRNRQSAVRHARNKSVRSEVKTALQARHRGGGRAGRRPARGARDGGSPDRQGGRTGDHPQEPGVAQEVAPDTRMNRRRAPKSPSRRSAPRAPVASGTRGRRGP